MSARTCLAAALAALLIALALPGVAAARPAEENVGPRSLVVAPVEPAPTVVRTTVIREEAVRALPIALSGAALLIAIGGTGLALVRIAPMRRELS